MQSGGKSGTRKAGSPDSLQSENPGTKEERKSEREQEGAELKEITQQGAISWNKVPAHEGSGCNL